MRVPFGTSTSCYEAHNTGEREAKYYFIGELWCLAMAVNELVMILVSNEVI